MPCALSSARGVGFAGVYGSQWMDDAMRLLIRRKETQEKNTREKKVLTRNEESETFIKGSTLMNTRGDRRMKGVFAIPK